MKIIKTVSYGFLVSIILLILCCKQEKELGICDIEAFVDSNRIWASKQILGSMDLVLSYCGNYCLLMASKDFDVKLVEDKSRKYLLIDDSNRFAKCAYLLGYSRDLAIKNRIKTYDLSKSFYNAILKDSIQSVQSMNSDTLFKCYTAFFNELLVPKVNIPDKFDYYVNTIIVAPSSYSERSDFELMTLQNEFRRNYNNGISDYEFDKREARFKF